MSEILSQPLIAIIILFGLLIFVHEFGHFIVGKLCGIGVEVFSIGFGPKVLSFTYNHTLYQVALIPLGGYVKFVGALPNEEVPPHFRGLEMHQAPLSKRALAIGAGPAANFLLAFFLYFILGMNGIEHPPSVVGQVMPDSPAEQAGFLSGDRIKEIDGVAVQKWEQFREVVSANPGKRVHIVVDRIGEDVSLSLIPEKIKGKGLFGGEITQGRAGIGMGVLPPIVTVLSSDSISAQSGLKTGDYITSVVNKKGDRVEVDSWQQFLSILSDLYKSHASTMSLIVEGTTLPLYNEKDDSVEFAKKNGVKRHLNIPLDLLREVEIPQSGSWGIQESIVLGRKLGLIDSSLTISEVREPESQSLLVPKDVIVAIDSKEIDNIYDLQAFLDGNKSENVVLTVLRDGSLLKLSLKLKSVDVQRPNGKETIYHLDALFLGHFVAPEYFVEKYDNIADASLFAMRKTAEGSMHIAETLWGLLAGTVPVQVLGGPILIAKVAGQAIKRGWETFLTSMALISINLGVINLFPIPILDGGQLVLVGAQAVRRKPLSEVAIENFQKIGFVMIMALVVLATYNDLSRFWASMVKDMIGIFR